MAPAPLLRQQFSSLNWGRKTKCGSVLWPPSAAAQLISTDPPSLVIPMNVAGCEGECWQCGCVLLSVTTGIGAVISSKRARQLSGTVTPEIPHRGWQRPSEHALRAHHFPCDEPVQTATELPIFISPHRVLISPYKQAFGCPLEAACSKDTCQTTLELRGESICIKDAPIIYRDCSGPRPY